LKKHLYIKTYGCQMNVYDSDRMADLLAPHGYEMSELPEGADMIILNTCHIREKATEKLFSDLGRLKSLKQMKQAAGGNMILAVAGCVAQAEGHEIIRRAPYVDIVLGPQTYHRLPEMIERSKRAAESKAQDNTKGLFHVVETGFPVESKFDHLPAPQNLIGTTAFLSIQEGCDKFCTFCVVPYTRGSEYSRPVQAVVSEAQELARQGIREITLLGQNVNAYHGASPDGKSEWGLGSLILKLADIEGIDRIRYTTSHPNDMDQGLIEAHGTCEKLMPFLHLPVQSGSDSILEAMNRKHTAAFYREIIETLKQKRSDIAFSSDFIVGFPGETDKDFQQTLKLIEDVKYAQAYSFKYSPRIGTPSSMYETQVPEDVKDERLQQVQALIAHYQKQFNTATIGKTLPVLFEKKGKHQDQYVGRTPYMQSVYVHFAEDIIGEMCHIEIKGTSPNSLTGVVVRGEGEKV
jgi:tRNA-2-methylthio-N6-dimethylallyladenosine synthase